MCRNHWCIENRWREGGPTWQEEQMWEDWALMLWRETLKLSMRALMLWREMLMLWREMLKLAR